MMTNMTGLITFGLSWTTNSVPTDPPSAFKIFLMRGRDLRNCGRFFQKSILNILTCAHDNQHVRLFLSTKRERERMMVIFYNPTSIHLSRAGWIMRKSCGLGHRRYWFPGSPIPRLYASRRHYFWAERENYGLQAKTRQTSGGFFEDKWFFEEKSGSSSVSGNRLFDSFVRGIGEKWSEMAGGGGGGTAWPDINDQQYRGIIPPILSILEQYWSKKALQKNHIQTLSLLSSTHHYQPPPLKTCLPGDIYLKRFDEFPELRRCGKLGEDLVKV